MCVCDFFLSVPVPVPVQVSTFMTDTFSSLGVSMDKKDPYAAFVRQHVCAVLSLAVGVRPQHSHYKIHIILYRPADR